MKYYQGNLTITITSRCLSTQAFGKVLDGDLVRSAMTVAWQRCQEPFLGWAHVLHGPVFLVVSSTYIMSSMRTELSLIQFCIPGS
jgi:hypothetical protein